MDTTSQGKWLFITQCSSINTLRPYLTKHLLEYCQDSSEYQHHTRDFPDHSQPHVHQAKPSSNMNPYKRNLVCDKEGITQHHGATNTQVHTRSNQVHLAWNNRTHRTQPDNQRERPVSPTTVHDSVLSDRLSADESTISTMKSMMEQYCVQQKEINASNAKSMQDLMHTMATMQKQHIESQQEMHRQHQALLHEQQTIHQRNLQQQRNEYQKDMSKILEVVSTIAFALEPNNTQDAKRKCVNSTPTKLKMNSTTTEGATFSPGPSQADLDDLASMTPFSTDLATQSHPRTTHTPTITTANSAVESPAGAASIDRAAPAAP